MKITIPKKPIVGVSKFLTSFALSLDFCYFVNLNLVFLQPLIEEHN